MPAFTRAFLFRISPSGEISYYIKKCLLGQTLAQPERNAQHYFPFREVRIIVFLYARE